MPLFFLILAALYLIGNGYIYLRSWEILHTFPLIWKWIFSVGYWAGTFSFFYIFGHRELPDFNPFLHILYYIGTGWLMFQPPVHNLSWSDYLIITGGYIHYSHPKKEVINLDINKEITGKKQIRVAAISDIHIGYGTTKERLQRYVRMIQAEKPDLIFPEI